MKTPYGIDLAERDLPYQRSYRVKRFLARVGLSLSAWLIIFALMRFITIMGLGWTVIWLLISAILFWGWWGANFLFRR